MVRGPEDFEFLDSFHRVKRFRSLFREIFCGTDPAAFLARLHYRGILKSRCPARWSLNRLQGLFERFLNAARHMTDAFPFSGKPLEEPGLMLLHLPEERCGDECFSSWVRVLDGMMPGMQFVMSVGRDARNRIPENILKQRLELPRNPAPPTGLRAIEDTLPDYILYPELRDRAIGFLTRGCPFRCRFCVVPLKEEGVRQVNSLDDLLQGDRSRLILLDDNLLAHPRASELLAEMAERGIQVNFNQTLDIRLLDREKAGLLRRIRYSNVAFNRRVIHFSLNDTSNLDLVQRKYRLMDFTPKSSPRWLGQGSFFFRFLSLVNWRLDSGEATKRLSTGESCKAFWPNPQCGS